MTQTGKAAKAQTQTERAAKAQTQTEKNEQNEERNIEEEGQ